MLEWMISSSALIIIVIALRYLLRGRISLLLQYSLWALVLVRLLVPFSFGSSRISVLNTVSSGVKSADSAPVAGGRTSAYTAPGAAVPSKPAPTPTAAAHLPGTASQTQTPGGVQTPGASVPEGAEDKASPKSEAKLDIRRVLAAVWLGGAALIALISAALNISLALKLRRSRRPVYVDGCRLKIYVSDAISTPCLFGLVSPAVYITADAAQDETQFGHILAHELAHYRHFDHIFSLLGVLAAALHWFNPLVWAAVVLSKRDRELACDASAIAHIGEDSRLSYARTLINLTCRDPRTLLLASTTMTASRRSIKERVRLITQKPHMTKLVFACVLAAAAIAVGCTFTGALEPGEKGGNEKPSEESVENGGYGTVSYLETEYYAFDKENDLLINKNNAGGMSVELAEAVDRYMLTLDKQDGAVSSVDAIIHTDEKKALLFFTPQNTESDRQHFFWSLLVLQKSGDDWFVDSCVDRADSRRVFSELFAETESIRAAFDIEAAKAAALNSAVSSAFSAGVVEKYGADRVCALLHPRVSKVEEMFIPEMCADADVIDFMRGRSLFVRRLIFVGMDPDSSDDAAFDDISKELFNSDEYGCHVFLISLDTSTGEYSAEHLDVFDGFISIPEHIFDPSVIEVEFPSEPTEDERACAKQALEARDLYDDGVELELVYDFDERPRYILAVSGRGFAIVDRFDGTVLECSGPNGIDPYADYPDSKKYYGGPLDYFVGCEVNGMKGYWNIPSERFIPADGESSAATEQPFVGGIIDALAAYHAAQFTNTAERGGLKLSEQVVSDLEKRQECISEMKKRMDAKFVEAVSSVERIQIDSSGENYTVSFYEITTVKYLYPGSGAVEAFGFGIDHYAVIALDGTVLADIFSEERATGFSCSLDPSWFTDPEAGLPNG